MGKSVIVACCVLLLASLGAHAQVYKWKDSSGRIQYSDTPPKSVPYSAVSSKKPMSQSPVAKQQEAKPATAPVAESRGDAEAQKKTLEEKVAREAEEKKRQEQQKVAAEKKAKEQRCQNARARQVMFQQGGRIYRTTQNGERVYYGDAEIDSELQKAKADIEANCTE